MSSIAHEELVGENIDEVRDRSPEDRSQFFLFTFFSFGDALALSQPLLELISPKDLYTACQMFPELNLPLRMRKFDSGLLVIQTMARYSDDEVSATIAKRIQQLAPGAGLTAVELASAIQISVALAQDQLLVRKKGGVVSMSEAFLPFVYQCRFRGRSSINAIHPLHLFLLSFLAIRWRRRAV